MLRTMITNLTQAGMTPWRSTWWVTDKYEFESVKLMFKTMLTNLTQAGRKPRRRTLWVWVTEPAQLVH